jgi:hypothetical protein
MWKRYWWRSTRRSRTFGYGGTAKMALAALLIVVLVIVVLRLLGLA